MSFRIRGLSPEPFQALFGLSAAELATHGAVRYRVNATPGFPDRIELRDCEPGETALLLNYIHQPADSPYRASHAIFVSEQSAHAFDEVNDVPSAMRIRTLSLRAFDDRGYIVDAELAAGDALPEAIERLLQKPAVAYLHAHYAKYGCYAARIDRN